MPQNYPLSRSHAIFPEHESEGEISVITFYQPPPPQEWGLSSVSPFCVKLETYLRMAKVPYQTSIGDPRKAPKRKIPYIGHNGKLMGDSSLIVEYLKTQFGDPLDQHLSPKQKCEGRAIKQMIEEHTYFCLGWLRWNTEESWQYTRKYFLSLLPPVVGGPLLSFIKKDFLKSLYRQGIGRHSRDEILAAAKKDIEVISNLLAKQSYILGEKPTSFDATLYGFLVQLLWVPFNNEEIKFARGFDNLTTYCERMHAQFWKDHEIPQRKRA